MWKRNVDDTCVIVDSTRKEEFFQHINSIDPNIQFTAEDPKSDGSIPFLDTLVMPQPNGSIKTTVFRKPTHTDMYLHWDSYHHLSAKYSVINTLRHRAKTVCSTSQLLQKKKTICTMLQEDVSTLYGPGIEWTSARTKREKNKGTTTTKTAIAIMPKSPTL